MKSRITKLAAVAVIIIVIMIGVNQFGGSIDLATITFADISEAMKNVPWMRMTNHGFGGNVEGPIELLIGFHTKIATSKDAKGKISLLNFAEHKSYKYDSENRTVTIDYLYEDDFPAHLSSAFSLVESMKKMSEQQGAHIFTTEGERDGEKVQLQDISMAGTGQAVRLYIQPDSKLLLAAQVRVTDPNGNETVAGEITFDYPQAGPVNIYDLGVPRNAQVINKLPREDFQEIWDNYRQKRADTTMEYIAVVTQINYSLGDIITMVDVDYKSNENHRLERHSVFKKGQQFNKFWPEYKEQLGDSFESLLAWTKAHYNNTGSISVYLYDGEFNFSTRRDDKGIWSKPAKDYSPGDESMPLAHLEYHAWPFIGKAGRIIEDNYAKEKKFICIERLQQGSVHSGNITLPGRFVYYLDPEKDYMCRRKVTEWRPDAEWQEDKNWLDGVEAEKIGDGSIHIEDTTDVIKAPNGHWYPKVIVVKHSESRKDYKETPLKVSSIKKVYVLTNPEFSEGIFEPNNLVPAGASIRKPEDKTTLEQAIAIIDGRQDWPEPRELVKAYWQARAKKDYDQMAVFWPSSSTWNRELLKNEKPAEYVFGEPRKATGKNVIVPYAEKSYYEKHGKYNLKMWLTNEKSAKGRYYIISGN